MKFSLHAGLVLRHGQRTLEIVRQLDDDKDSDNVKYQLEDCITRYPTIIDRLMQLTRRSQSGTSFWYRQKIWIG